MRQPLFMDLYGLYSRRRKQAGEMSEIAGSALRDDAFFPESQPEYTPETGVEKALRS